MCDAEKYQTIAAWQNTIDLTAFVKTQTSNFGLLLARDDANNSNKIFTSEATGIENAKCDFFNNCTAADLVPQLTVTFRKTGTTGTDHVKSVEKEDNAIYNLAGQRLLQVPQKGFYIKNGRKYIAK